MENEKKRKEEMLLYKRELLNREENFNAIFASNVGGISSKFKDHSVLEKESRYVDAVIKPVNRRSIGRGRFKRDKTAAIPCVLDGKRKSSEGENPALVCYKRD